MDYKLMTPREAVVYAHGANAFPKEFIEEWEVRSLSSSDYNKIRLTLSEWKDAGFTTKKKSYSEFISICGVKRKY